MKKLMFVSVAAISMAVFAGMPETKEIVAKADGYYDVTLTTKHLAHAEKTVSKTFTTSKTKGYAYDQLMDHLATVTNYAGFRVISGGITADIQRETAKKIAIKYSYFDFDKNGNMKTKIVSKSSNGLYDAKSGAVYLWDTADKVGVQYGDTDAIVKSKQKKGVEQIQTGYKAYEVPLAMHKQFVATDDNKAAGGFKGGYAEATDGSYLDFRGLRAFGTGTIDSKTENLKTVSGNVAGKYPNDLKFGCYGTWKLNLDSKSAKYATLNDALLAKKCVELVNERD